jgi:hypothetical protein
MARHAAESDGSGTGITEAEAEDLLAVVATAYRRGLVDGLIAAWVVALAVLWFCS